MLWRTAADYRFKTAQCYTYQKTGHLARVCLSREWATPTIKSSISRRAKGNDVHQITVVIVLKDNCMLFAS